MGYDRVLPRDLFNEAKLLKCLGQLCMLIHDELCNLRVYHNTKYYEGFNIQQDASDGGLFVQNLEFTTLSGMPVCVCVILNARSPYPMLFQLHGNEYLLFNDDGQLSAEYFEHLHGA